MPPSSLVSVVIPCYNPTRYLEETLASVRAQTYSPVEVILVNDGTDTPEGCALLRSLAAGVNRLIEQPNHGLAAARNAGFRAAAGAYVVPLDADDRLKPEFIAACVAEIEAHPEAAFVYTDYRVFGDARYVERLADYNLFHLLSNNTLIYAALIRRADWEAAGGYDDAMRFGYEDWDFWLRLAERGRYGRHLPRPLFEYRKHGRSLLSTARERHQELVEKIRASHSGLYSWQGRARIKARWAPAVCVLGPELEAEQTIEDWERLPTTDPRQALEQSNAAAFLIPKASAVPRSDSAELCALAVWGGHDVFTLPGGSLCASRDALAATQNLRELAKKTVARAGTRRAASPVFLPGRLERLHRHLVNAELTSLDAWLRHPARSAGRLIPLRVKEQINRATGRPVFDLSFYLKFQPQSVFTPDALVEPLRYMPRPAEGRRRIALLTPHLGPGGAETVLWNLARALARHAQELFLIATQSQDSRWRPRWEEAADHVYDLAPLVRPERLIAAIYSLALNWEFDFLVIQNSLAAYSAIPFIRKDRPSVKIIDLVHAVDETWDFVSSTGAVAAQIDCRVAISEAGRQRLARAGTPPEKIRLIRNGIDLERFHPVAGGAEAARNILFAGRLDPVKRPLLLVDIAAELARLLPEKNFHFLVAGDGPESAALRARVEAAGLAPLFRLLGHVEDVPALLKEAAVVVVPSQAEGVPLIVLEALAMERPVVCSRVGAASEAVDHETGVMIDPGPDEAGRFAAAIHGLLEDPARRAALGRAGRRKVASQYNWGQSQQAYRALFPEA